MQYFAVITVNHNNICSFVRAKYKLSSGKLKNNIGKTGITAMLRHASDSMQAKLVLRNRSFDFASQTDFYTTKLPLQEVIGLSSKQA